MIILMRECRIDIRIELPSQLFVDKGEAVLVSKIADVDAKADAEHDSDADADADADADDGVMYAEEV